MSEQQPVQPSLTVSPTIEHPRTIVLSEVLFEGRRELWIEHEGEHYRLRITRRNKLILQK